MKKSIFFTIKHGLEGVMVNFYGEEMREIVKKSRFLHYMGYFFTIFSSLWVGKKR